MMEGPEVTTTISSFGELREKEALYVDKTAYLYRLVTGSDMYFFSRPRRFGKTLTVSTLEAIFQGRRELFKGLAIDKTDYDWKTYPVVHIDFGSCEEKTAEGLNTWLCERLSVIARKYGVVLQGREKSSVRFTQLLESLSAQGKVVILVDEYDKVLSDHALSDNVLELRDPLKGFYDVIKTENSLLRFAFITGVTKFSKVGVFSGMNNLYDATFDLDYGTMLGYTQEELETYFAGYIDQGVKDTGMERATYLARIKGMYDGYRFALDTETVYNPVSVGLFFTRGHGRDFDDYLIETGNMKLVMDMAQSVDLDVIRDLKDGMDRDALGSFDITLLKGMEGDVNKVQAFLLQTGYLTIDSKDGDLFMLRFPNAEVRNAYSKAFLNRLYQGRSQNIITQMENELKKGNTEGFMDLFVGYLAKIPYRQAKKEADFAQLAVAITSAMSEDVWTVAENMTSEGRIDLSLTMQRQIYVVEFKVDTGADAALKQIKDKHYADKFRLERGKAIHLLGIAFSSTGHTVQDWKEEVLDQYHADTSVCQNLQTNASQAGSVDRSSSPLD